MNTFNEPILIADSAHGIYCPQQTIRALIPEIREQISKETQEELQNPENEFYWESWENLLDLTLVTPDGYSFYLYQSEHGDVWAVPTTLSPEKHEEFFGESIW